MLAHDQMGVYSTHPSRLICDTLQEAEATVRQQASVGFTLHNKILSSSVMPTASMLPEMQ